ncbi:hypothetical protein COB28_01925 [Candidatus Dependentiae bacterium]|nr:MAG: hypothetical protein COB28_01925 [Candidatus Dependentiae bacterium]
MKLQIAYNFSQLSTALDVAKKTGEYADIIEIGYSLICIEGIRVIRAFKELFPDKPIAVNTKIIESSHDLIKIASLQGAQYITVLAGAANHVIQSSTTTAHSNRSKVMLDLIDAPSTGQSAMDASTLEVDYLLFHRSKSSVNATELQEEWINVKGNTTVPIFITGKVDKSSVVHYCNLKPAGIIIGNAITQADNPEEEAQYFKSIVSP